MSLYVELDIVFRSIVEISKVIKFMEKSYEMN